MFRRLLRLFLGLVEGLVIGVALAMASARGLGLSAPGTVLAALLAAAAGLAVGLIAGRPVWARDAKTEALLKGGVGALIGAGLSVALGRWLTPSVDLAALTLGSGPAGRLVGVSLPLIATALALFFELDNTSTSAERPPLPAAKSKQRLSTSSELDDEIGLEHESERKIEKR